MKTLKERLKENWPSVIAEDVHCDLSCGAGWHPLIWALAQKIHSYNTKHSPANPTVFLQIKEKFGGLRVYINGTTGASEEQLKDSDAIFAAIEFCENGSYAVCENCGKPGTTRHERSWLKVLCDDCDTPPKEPNP